MIKIKLWKMNFILLITIIQSSLAGQIFKRLRPAQAQLPTLKLAYGGDAGN